ncbi:MAG: phage portal protein [Phycisphaerales bacterium]|nr:phage portal protein [Phycisphaerales bacterium]
MKQPNLIQRLISVWKVDKEINVEKNKPTASFGTYGRAYAIPYDGEKNAGEIGPAFDYILDFDMLRIRSWQSYLESDISQTILNKYVLWMIDEGLKLQSSPANNVLAQNGINVDTEKFNEITESRFSIWAGSTMSAFNGMTSLNGIAKEVYKNSKIGGDCLVVLRLIDGIVKVQLIDGAHIQTDFTTGKPENGNKIVQGIEIDKNGKHVAFYVKTATLEYERISAFGEQSGLVMAFMVYGSKFRVDNHRGMPILGTSLESLAKIDRYKEAAVGSAEERQKIPYSIEHDNFSSGESPLASQIASAFDAGQSTTTDNAVDSNGEILANTVAVSTNKQVFNMPIGAKLKALNSQNEMFFESFYSTIANTVCSAIGIPPNVAFSIYNDSFSASRTATKDWEHTMTVERKDFSFQFYQKVYSFWLHIQILQNKIQAPGYLTAFSNGDIMTIEAWRKSRFTGAMFPHIDPLKEVKAEREKLGDTGKSIPLTTVERATEILNGGDSNSNMEQYSTELKKSKDLNIIIEPDPIVNPGG